jgi:hypothetical protein
MTRSKAAQRNRGNLVGDELADVLDKVATFFLAAGVTPGALASLFSRSISRSTPKLGMHFVRDEQTLEQVRAIDIWHTSSKYANAAGKPKRLPIEGKLSIASLMREGGMRADPNKTAKTLVRRGTIQENEDGTFSPTDRIANWRKVGEIAYGPQAAFLMNAVTASTVATNNDRFGQKLFWKFSLSDRLPEHLIDEYLSFVKGQSTTLMRQLDDWLAQHESLSVRRRGKGSPIAVGVGLFPFVQTVPVGKPQKNPRKAKRSRS